MLTRSKLSLAIGASCAAGAVLAGGATAHGGGDHGSRGGLQVEVRGIVTTLTAPTESAAASITVSPGGTLAPWTCALRRGADTTGIVANTTTVKMKCRVRKGVLTAKRLRTTGNTEGKVRVEGRGRVTAFTAPVTTTTPAAPAVPATPEAPGTSKLFEKPATPPDPAAPGGSTTTPGSITIDPGKGIQAVTCAITGRTRLRGTPVAGTSMARFACRSSDDALVAKRIIVKRDRSESRSERRRGDDGDRKGRR